MRKNDQISNRPICLINPPIVFSKNIFGLDLFQPLGLAYIAAILKENHYSVFVIDAAAEGWEKIQEFDEDRNYNGLNFTKIGKKIKKLKPKIIGITIPFTVQKDSAFKVASVVKAINKNIIVIVGGPHVTVRPEECLKNPNIDFAVIGEGEETIVELVNKLNAGVSREEFKKIKGIAYKAGSKIIINENRPLIENLDSLPFPARDLLPMKNYFKAAKSKRASRDLDKPWASVFTSRGCPFGCVFCSIHLSMGRKWRARSPKNIIEELKLLTQKYGIKQIDFEDDNISCNPKRMEEICDLIIDNNIKIEWFTPNGVRADTLDESLLKKMKASGCRELWFAPESGSQRVVDEVIGKKIDLKYIEKMVCACKKIGISSNCFFVIGLPGETKKEIRETISFARKLGRLGADNCLFSIATPLYGTRLYKEAVENGYLIKIEGETLNYEKPLLKTKEFTPEELINFRNKALADNRKWYILNSLNKLYYYLFNNPYLAAGHLKNMSKTAKIFFRRFSHKLAKDQN